MRPGRLLDNDVSRIKKARWQFGKRTEDICRKDINHKLVAISRQFRKSARSRIAIYQLCQRRGFRRFVRFVNVGIRKITHTITLLEFLDRQLRNLVEWRGRQRWERGKITARDGTKREKEDWSFGAVNERIDAGVWSGLTMLREKTGGMSRRTDIKAGNWGFRSEPWFGV
jgi:hypothetical protein